MESSCEAEMDFHYNFYGSLCDGLDDRSSLSSSTTSDATIPSYCTCKNTCSRKTTVKTKGCPCKTYDKECSENCKCGTSRASCRNKAIQEENHEIEPDRIICSCKNTCSRKRTEKSAGCPCKTAMLECSNRCKCGTSISQCKNKTIEQVVNRNPSAFARHQEQFEKAETEIKEFIQHLSSQDKDLLLLKLLTQGRGSLQFAKDILEGDQAVNPSDPVPGPSQQPEWCVCGICQTMPLEIENKCCGKRTCVTCYEMFQNICIDREVLTLAIRARFDIMAEEADYSANSFRKASYRQFCLWKYGKLGRGNRRVLPSCVVRIIRQAYPAADGHYMGYKES